jgi:hypothetical protein
MEAAVSGGGHGGSAWEMSKTCRGKLRRWRHAGYYPLSTVMAGPRALGTAASDALTVAATRSVAGLRSRWDGQRDDHREHREDTLHGLSLSPLVDETASSIRENGPRPSAPVAAPTHTAAAWAAHSHGRKPTVQAAYDG